MLSGNISSETDVQVKSVFIFATLMAMSDSVPVQQESLEIGFLIQDTYGIISVISIIS